MEGDDEEGDEEDGGNEEEEERDREKTDELPARAEEAAATPDYVEMPEKASMPEVERTQRGPIDGMLIIIVKFILAGVEAAVLISWVLGRVADGLGWAVDLGMFLLQPPK